RLPFLVDSAALQLVLALPEQVLRHVVEGLLLRTHLRPHGPPYVCQDTPVEPPKPFAQVEEGGVVPREGEPLHPVLRGPFAEDPEGGTERVARLEPFGHKEQVCPVTSLRILGRSHDSDGRPEIHIIDEPMLERDVRFQRSRSELACLFPVFRRLPGLSEDHAGAGRRPAFHFQGHVLEGDHLLVAGERTPHSLGWRDDEEVGLEPGVLDRDTLPFAGAAEHLDDRHLGILRAVHGLATIRGGDDPNVERFAHAFATILMTSPSSTGWSRPTTIFVRALMARMKWFPKSVCTLKATSAAVEPRGTRNASGRTFPLLSDQ